MRNHGWTRKPPSGACAFLYLSPKEEKLGRALSLAPLQDGGWAGHMMNSTTGQSEGGFCFPGLDQEFLLPGDAAVPGEGE